MTLTLTRPWSNIGTAHRLIILDICAKLFVNPTRDSKDIERTRNTVIQCLILNCDLDPSLVKHRHCTSSHHNWDLCKVICKSHQGFKRYRADTKYSHTIALFTVLCKPLLHWGVKNEVYSAHMPMLAKWCSTITYTNFKMFLLGNGSFSKIHWLYKGREAS